MRVFVSITSGSNPPRRAMRSCREIARRDGDVVYEAQQVEHGHLVRGGFLLRFLELEQYDAWLMLDGDQVQPPDLLERLRETLTANNLDMVTAHYYGRATHPVQSFCYPVGDGTWPYQPYLDPPTEGLHELACCGMGCVLIRREVVQAVQALQPPGMNAMDIAPLPEMTGDQRPVGSDFRFFWQARQLGYRLWLDAGIESLHTTTILLGHKSARALMDYILWANDQHETLLERLNRHGMTLESLRQRLTLLEARHRGLRNERDYELNDPNPGHVTNMEKVAQLNAAMFIMEGRLAECQTWLEWLAKYPPITRPGQLPTTETAPLVPPWELMPDDDAAAIAERLGGHKKIAEELAEGLPANGQHG